MDKFPQNHELIELFESEPLVLDPNVPWFYNSLTFELRRSDEQVQVVIQPAYGSMRVRWRRLDRELVALDVDQMLAFRIEVGGPVEALIASFAPGVADLRIETKPAIRISWGTALVKF